MAKYRFHDVMDTYFDCLVEYFDGSSWNPVVIHNVYQKDGQERIKFQTSAYVVDEEFKYENFRPLTNSIFYVNSKNGVLKMARKPARQYAYSMHKSNTSAVIMNTYYSGIVMSFDSLVRDPLFHESWAGKFPKDISQCLTNLKVTCIAVAPHMYVDTVSKKIHDQNEFVIGSIQIDGANIKYDFDPGFENHFSLLEGNNVYDCKRFKKPPATR